ncbi:MAG: hypothetical protein AAF789_00415 [Bacteroidota bacterium]
MAELCSHCSQFGEDYPYNFDLISIDLRLKPGYSQIFLCEGCEIRGVYKDNVGLIYLAEKVGKEVELEKVKIEKL